MLRCRICGEIVEMSNAEAEIISQYGEEFAEREGMIRCNGWTECDECEKEKEQEEKEKEWEALMHEHELYDF